MHFIRVCECCSGTGSYPGHPKPYAVCLLGSQSTEKIQVKKEEKNHKGSMFSNGFCLFQVTLNVKHYLFLG